MKKPAPPPIQETTSHTCYVSGNFPAVYLIFRVSSKQCFGFSYQHLANFVLLDDYHEENGTVTPQQRLIFEFSNAIVTLHGIRLSRLLGLLSLRMIHQFSLVRHSISQLIPGEVIVSSIKVEFLDGKGNPMPSKYQPIAAPPGKVRSHGGGEGLPEDDLSR